MTTQAESHPSVSLNTRYILYTSTNNCRQANKQGQADQRTSDSLYRSEFYVKVNENVPAASFGDCMDTIKKLLPTISLVLFSAPENREGENPTKLSWAEWDNFHEKIGFTVTQLTETLSVSNAHLSHEDLHEIASADGREDDIVTFDSSDITPLSQKTYETVSEHTMQKCYQAGDDWRLLTACALLGAHLPSVSKSTGGSGGLPVDERVQKGFKHSWNHGIGLLKRTGL